MPQMPFQLRILIEDFASSLIQSMQFIIPILVWGQNVDLVQTFVTE